MSDFHDSLNAQLGLIDFFGLGSVLFEFGILFFNHYEDYAHR
jgi:hypothetical protein